MLITIPCRDKFFEETSKHYKEILEEFKGKNGEIFTIVGPWDFSPIYDILGSMPSQVSEFKSIVDNIESVTDYTIAAIGMSIFPVGKPRSPHTDNHPTDGRFKRYHLPLQLTDTSFIHVLENGTNDWKQYPWELGKWMEFEGIQHTHYPYNEDPNNIPRIVLILDVFEGEALDQDVWDYYIEIEKLGWISDNNFRPHYEKYILNKKNK
jgi:hypothetical protein